MTAYYRKNRIKEALSARGLKQVELCEKTGIKKSALNSWISQRWQPKQDSLYKIAQALDVSEMWLAGYDVPMERPEPQKKSDELAQLILQMKNDSELMKLCTSISMLNNEQRNTIKNVVTELSKLNSVH